MSEMVRVKTAELKGLALDWLVGTVVEAEDLRIEDGRISCDYRMDTYCGAWAPSSDWDVGGPLIERFRVGVIYIDHLKVWEAGFKHTSIGYGWKGYTPLSAAMRAIVAIELGDEVEVPAELAGGLGNAEC